MSLPPIWYHQFQFLTNFRKFAKSEKVRFIKKAGKLAKFVILFHNAHKGEVQLQSLARVEAELTRIKAWIHQHLHFD